MSVRTILLAALVVLIAARQVPAQTTPPGAVAPAVPAWRPIEKANDPASNTMPTAAALPPASPPSPATPAAAAAAESPRRFHTRVTSGPATLPNQQGQVWREYDITPYTSRVTTTRRPEQAIVDWILRETGYEAWHSEPLGILSATSKSLRVYHTPQMQAVITDLVDRFVASEAQTYTFSLHIVTLDSPNWRARGQNLLRPVQVQTPGTSAWLLQKEDMSMLLAELRRRSDYREHSSPYLLVNNGQATVVSATRTRSYVRSVIARPAAWPSYEAQTGQIDEGFSLDFSPLLTADRRLIDATIKCHIDQVEKMVPVILEVPTPAAPRQRAKIEVPQISHFRFHERFRWPVEQVLLVSMGIVALPVPVDAKATVAGLPLPLPGTAPRAELLVFVESKGAPQAPAPPPAAAASAPAVPTTPLARPPQLEAKTYRGRY